MSEPRPDAGRSVRELHPHVEHLGREVPVGEPAPAERAALTGIEPDADAADVRLEADGPLDGPGEPGGRGPAHGDAEVLVEDPPELDPGLEQERLAPRDRGRMDPAAGHERAALGASLVPTENGPPR